MSKIIKFVLRQPYSHSEYVVSDWLTVGTDLSRPVSIQPFGYNISDVEIWRLKHDVDEDQDDIIIEFLQKATKIKYDWWEAVCVGLRLPFKHKKDRYICISLIIQAMEKAGVIPEGTNKKYAAFDVFTKSGYFTKC